MLADVNKAGHNDTSGLESVHSLLNRYAPRMQAFSYSGQLSRLVLCANLDIKNKDAHEQENWHNERALCIVLFCGVQLAILHHSENVNNPVRKSEDGQVMWGISRRKFNKQKPIAVALKIAPTYSKCNPYAL